MKKDKKNIQRMFSKDSKRFYSPEFDPLGRYTGTSADLDEEPEQDADDL